MHHKKIMIVEDEVVVSTALRSKLEKLGYKVDPIIRYGEKALEAARQSKPDLVLMDIKLKGEIDGIEAAQHIHEQLNLPVVFLTAYSDDATLTRAKAAEPFYYLKKPVRLDDLRIAIDIAFYKAEMEQKLRKSELHFRTVADYTYDWETWIGPEGDLIYMSPSCERITGYSLNEFFKDPQLLYKIVHPNEREAFKKHFKQHRQSETDSFEMEYRILRSDGEIRWLEHRCQPVYAPDGEYIGRRGGNRDITDRKKAEIEREDLIRELKEALDKIKTLEGFIPICSNCMKIRDDKGYWQKVERYIQDRTDAKFSHGICPDCMNELYPDLLKKDDN